MDVSCAVSQVRLVAVWRPSVEWQRRGVEARWVQVVLLPETTRGEAARMYVGLVAASGHGLVQPEYGWMRGVTSVTAVRDWLAAISCRC
jgi:hypothetical protein